MFDIVLSDQSNVPLYVQLYTQIRHQIRSGAITDGTRMPSVRSLQLQLNISKTPIETAYHMLVSEGYVRSKPRSGLYAMNPFELGHASEPTAAAPDQTIGGVQPPAEAKGWIDFNPTHLDASMFPLRIWRKMWNDAMATAAERLNQYGDPQGEYSFRRVIADYIRQARGVVCSPEQILIGSGMTYSLGILTTLLAGITEMAMENPGFAKVRQHFSLRGFTMTPISIGEAGLSLDELENSAAQAVYVTPSHQFPTGSVMPYVERERLLKWASARDAYIVEDDYDGEFRYYGKPIPSLQSLDVQGRVIYIGTFSKAFTPALRMNYIVLPLALGKKMDHLNHLLSSPSRVDQWAMQAFIEQGHWYRHIRRTRNTYRKKHHRLIELLETHFGDRLAITGHSAGLHLQVSIRTHVKAEQLVEMAMEQGVHIYDLHQTWMDDKAQPPGDPKVYLGFGGLSDMAMERGVLLLKKAWSCLWQDAEAGD